MSIHQNKFMDFFYMPDLVNLVKVYINDQFLGQSPKQFSLQKKL